MENVSLFHNSLEGIFIERPNRYIVTVSLPDGRKIRAYCPNPGRLIELLIPGRRLILEERGSWQGNGKSHTGLSPQSADHRENRKTRYTLVAAYYGREIVPLYSSRANFLARELIIPALFAPYERLDPEVKLGKSRIDFLLTRRHSGKNEIHYIEVKACTLIEEEVAMFPDAPTARGRKHLTELSTFPARAYETGIPNTTEGRPHVIFAIMNPSARRFIPNMHTDLEFARKMLEVRENVFFHAVTMKTDRNGFSRIFNPSIPIDWETAQNNSTASGIYLLSVYLEKQREISVGSLGKVSFKAGYYVYVGSALNNMDKRITRHRRKRKVKNWHIDYLTGISDRIKDYPVRTSRRLECKLAGDISSISKASVPGFGSSGCSCNSHLFYFSSNPEENESFLEVLFRYRHRLSFCDQVNLV